MEAIPIPWKQFTAELLKLYQEPMRSKRTAAKMRGTLQALEAMGVQSTADLTAPLVAQYITTRCAGLQSVTIHGHLLYIQAAANQAEAMGVLPYNPFKLRKMRQWIRVQRTERQRHFSRDEIARVLAVMRQDVADRKGWALWKARRLYALTSVFAYCGLRRDECLKSFAGDFDLEARVMKVVARDGNRLKTEKSEATVPLPIALIPTLADWTVHRLDAPPNIPLTEAQRACPFMFPNLTRSNAWIEGEHGHRPLDRLQAIGRRAGVEGLTFRALRHSLATHAEFWGLGEMMTQRILRHTTTKTQTLYRHEDLENMRALADRIQF